jgi:hypothetical protein
VFVDPDLGYLEQKWDLGGACNQVFVIKPRKLAEASG